VRKVLQQIGVAFGAWTAVAVLAYARVPLQALANGSALPPWSSALDPLVSCWLWALFTPPILWLAARFPLDRRAWFRNGLVHLAAAAVSVLASAAPTLLINRLLDVPGHSRGMAAQILAELFIDVFSYAALAALGHALAYQRVSTEQRVRAGELEARLLAARMEALEARMHPHFLFNALNTASSLVRAGESQGAVRALARLGELLRSLLLEESHEVPLAQELEFVGRYLELEQARFGERLSSRIEADPSAMGALVPRLLLQPLVENALRFAIEPSPDPGRVEVRAMRSGETLEVEVRDSGGPGSRSTPDESLATTQARLEQMYGGRQQLALRSDELGTVTRLVIPFRPRVPLQQ